MKEIKLNPNDDAMGTISRCRCCGAENGNGVYGEECHKLAFKDWNNRPIEDELRKELRRFKKYSAALEEKIKGLRSTVNELKFLLELSKTPDAKEQEKIQKLYEEAMKGGEE